MAARRRHDREELLRAAVEVCAEGGLPALSFGAVARRAGVPDRTVVYYFATKPVLVDAVIDVMAAELMGRLDAALGSSRRRPDALIADAWPVLADPAVQPVTRVWLEMSVLATRPDGPHRSTAQRLALAWLGWLADRIDAPTSAVRRDAAAATLARLDGALLLDLAGLHDEARAAVGA